MLEKLERKIAELKAKAVRVYAAEYVKQSQQAFRDGGFTDKALEPWVPSRKEKGATLVKTGALRRSIKVRSVTQTTARVGSTGLTYASKHQFGKGVPKREFIGRSETANQRARALIRRLIKDTLK